MQRGAFKRMRAVGKYVEEDGAALRVFLRVVGAFGRTAGDDRRKKAAVLASRLAREAARRERDIANRSEREARAYDEEHRAKRLAQDKARYVGARAESQRVRSAARYASLTEKQKAAVVKRASRRRRERGEEARAHRRAWKKANRDVVNAAQRRYRARRKEKARGNGGGSAPCRPGTRHEAA